MIQKKKRSGQNWKTPIILWGYIPWDVPSENFNKTVDYLNARGYSIVAQVELNTKPSWLAGSSTVFYYDASSRALAQSLATDIGNITHTKLRVQQGAGLGVPEGMGKQYLYVHLVGRPVQRTD